jgi:hypothetical protein
MTTPHPDRSPLYEMEMEVLEEGREWMRQRLEKKLQKKAEAEGRISPPQPAAHQEHPIPHATDPKHGG